MMLIGQLCASNAHPLNHFPTSILFSGWILGFVTIALVLAWEHKWASTTAAGASLFCFTLFYLSSYLPGQHTTTTNYGDSMLGIYIGLTMLTIVNTLALCIGCISYLGVDHRLRKHTSLPPGPSLIRIDQINRLFLTFTTLSLSGLVFLGIAGHVNTKTHHLVDPVANLIHGLAAIVCAGFFIQLVRRYVTQVKLKQWVMINLWLTVGIIVVVIYYVSRWGHSLNV